jgi:hypothetical protein
MQDSLDVYYFLKIVRNQVNLSTDQVRLVLASHYKLPKFSMADCEVIIELFDRFPPENTLFVQYLREKHYKNAFIRDLLQITNATVNYHLGKQVKKKYVNGVAEQYIRNLLKPYDFTLQHTHF